MDQDVTPPKPGEIVEDPYTYLSIDIGIKIDC